MRHKLEGEKIGLAKYFYNVSEDCLRVSQNVLATEMYIEYLKGARNMHNKN